MLTDRSLLRLMTWLSPGFPVGAFTYSHGLEYAVEEGLVGDGEALRAWVEGIVTFGAGRLDAALFRRAWEAADDAAALDDASELAHCLRGSSELALESSAQGAAFLRAVRDTWPHPVLDAWAARLDAAGRPAPYAVAVGATAAAQGIALRPALGAFLHAFAANLVSAGVRLVPLGQTAGQRALAALEPAILDAVDAALAADPEDLGAAAPVVDWCSIRHETQYTRLFRS
ncbi:MAG: urease accessory protein UreF [Hyphomicrobiales bacterium]|nr:urease accessory protein UreF [Hyphomicrobiales bacterium]MCP5371722.1 urease accessory protein UreF [Hyphomicrobiales bacterium]